MPAGVGRRSVVADETDDLLAAAPCVYGWSPCRDEFVLGRDLPFQAALGLDRPVLLALQSSHFRRSFTLSPCMTPD
jgi:hypothetical protein